MNPRLSMLLRRQWRRCYSLAAAEGFALDRVLSSQDPTEGYAALVRRYGGERDACKVRSAHEHIARSGFANRRFLANLLVQSYGKCGCVEEARAVFDSIQSGNAISYSSMIMVYAQAGHHLQALELYHRMVALKVPVDAYVFSIVLGVCSSSANVAEGRGIHQRMISTGMRDNVRVNNALVHMYAKCGCLDEARNVFESMQKKDVVTWTTLISAYAQEGHHTEALHLYRALDRDNSIRPDKFLLATVLGCCSTLEEGKAIYARIASFCRADEIVESALVRMYARCGSLEDAKRTFDRLQSKHKVAAPWAVMISAYAGEERYKEALSLFWKMQDEGLQADKITYATIVSVSANNGDLEEGKAVHRQLVQSCIETDIVLETALVSMYCKCGDLKLAREIFDGMKERNVISWTVMIQGYSQLELHREAIDLYKRMVQEQVQPNRFTLVAVFAACSTPEHLDEGMAIHASLPESGYDLVQVAVINMYAKCGCMEEAMRAFNDKTNLVAWTTLIASYAQHQRPQKALDLYLEMLEAGVEPDVVTYTSVLTACGMLGLLEEGKQIHARIVERELPVDQVLENTLLNMYCKLGSLKEAKQVFDKMKEEAQHISWKYIIPACANLGDLEHGEAVHRAIRNSCCEEEAQPSLINMYARCGRLDYSKLLFDRIKVKTAGCWCSLIGAYALCGKNAEAINIYKRMEAEQNVQPDNVTFATVLGACANSGALKEGRAFHRRIIELKHPPDVVMETALVNMYGKCGALEEAHSVFDSMPERNMFTWTALLTSYSLHGHGRTAIGLCKQMDLEGIPTDGITLISVLASCSCVGLLEEAWQYFRHMEPDRGFSPLYDHYICMIDVLGRAGRLQDAENLIADMPFEACAVAWSTLLASCTSYKDMKRAWKAAERVQKLDPANMAARVLLANTYSGA